MTILQHVVDDVLAHAREEAPRECCGMLLGSAEQIVAAVRARNLAEGHSRFLVDPQDHVSALRFARSRGIELVGFYHSHPRSAAYPSETDVAESSYACVVHLIAGVTEAGPELRLFMLDRPILELPLVVTGV